ncbi:asr4301 [Nostoc sp. PCC 7120 = FACHB-418]|nr:asr4301 [Nostoc sp. PCC 7120 = FACHB-418]
MMIALNFSLHIFILTNQKPISLERSQCLSKVGRNIYQIRSPYTTVKRPQTEFPQEIDYGG